MVGLFERADGPKQAIHLMLILFLKPKIWRDTLVALALFLSSGLAAAQLCTTTIESDDAFRFTPEKIEIPLACKTFTLTLKHTGRLPKLAMGHNWVLAKLSDLNGVARTGMLAGADHNYVDLNDTRVLAYTNVIGGGESASVTFEVAKLVPGERYGFICTFAGHSPLMRGAIDLK